MILPTKHLTVEGSLLGQGAVVLTQITGPTTVSRLWEATRADRGIVSFDRFILTLDFLFAVGAIDREGSLIRRSGR